MSSTVKRQTLKLGVRVTTRASLKKKEKNVETIKVGEERRRRRRITFLQQYVWMHSLEGRSWLVYEDREMIQLLTQLLIPLVV